MKSNIDLIAFGTFGIPNGFRQTSLLIKSDNFSKVKTFDLNTNAIKIFPNAKVYSIRKQLIDEIPSIAYSVYSFAKEKSSDRGGTFVGASILFFENVAPESLILNCLDDFHDQLVSNIYNIKDSVIQVNHSDEFRLPTNIRDFEKISFNFRQIGDINFIPTQKDLVVYEIIKPELFEKSLELLNVYDTIFFTKSDDVAKFVHEKQLLKIANQQKDFQIEIDAYRTRKEEEKKRALASAIEKIENEIYRLDEAKHIFLRKSNHEVSNCEKTLEENNSQLKKLTRQNQEKKDQLESSKKLLKSIAEQYDQVKTNFATALEKLKIGSVDVEKVFNQLRIDHKELEDTKNKITIPSVTKISNSSERDFFNKTSRYEQNSSYTVNVSDGSSKKISKKTKTYKLAMIFFCLLWLFTIIYFLYFEQINSLLF